VQGEIELKRKEPKLRGNREHLVGLEQEMNPCTAAEREATISVWQYVESWKLLRKCEPRKGIDRVTSPCARIEVGL